MLCKRFKKLIAAVLVTALLCGCGAHGDGNKTDSSDEPVTSEAAEASGEAPEKEKEETQALGNSSMAVGERPFLMGADAGRKESDVVPCVERYTVEPDLSNVDNLWQFYLEEGMTEKLSENGFVVSGFAGNEFFEIYETNRYNMVPNFVTVDSMMHTYHLYFSYLLKSLEKDYLAERLTQLSSRMLAGSVAQYEKLKGSEWENAAKRNVAFFTVGAKLLDNGTQIHEAVKDTVSYELEHIGQANGIDICQITADFEDYSQYKPRGYYEGDEKLEAYFKAMMWYGRIHFKQDNEELNRSALLITKAMDEDAEGYSLWESIYAVTSFFAGASDDCGVCEYAKVIREAYGDSIAAEDLIGNEQAFSTYLDQISKLPAPSINSIPIWDEEENVIPGFRFMGQRFTIDATIMQQLIYSNVKENSAGDKRMLPDVLDVPAALGSDKALEILKENGATDYAGYSENMEKLKDSLARADDTLWSASLYAGWLNTLRPLLNEKGEGYPLFMQSEEWTKKDLECFAGSFTELKHDTVLYTKQVIAEMGGGMEEEPDDRGYVEPEPIVYKRFADLADKTARGLESYGMLSDEDKENLSRLSALADQLLIISEKELRDETLTEAEYDLIRGYGGSIEHFWYETVKGESDEDFVATQECPAAIVVDIATDPNGTVLEAATGNPSTILVAVKVDGKLKLARGSVYSFYQFPQPLENRLTDSQWRVMIGIQADENGNYNYHTKIDKPEWTESYRFKYDWE
ncbi:MAG: DUF3160 domain-containing protein [Lachnospiraceae bacterium]|nr:DUF3160 domain-containing protein [Lachnospiraceae bacterium]